MLIHSRNKCYFSAYWLALRTPGKKPRFLPLWVFCSRGAGEKGVRMRKAVNTNDGYVQIGREGMRNLARGREPLKDEVRD